MQSVRDFFTTSGMFSGGLRISELPLQCSTPIDIHFQKREKIRRNLKKRKNEKRQSAFFVPHIRNDSRFSSSSSMYGWVVP